MEDLNFLYLSSLVRKAQVGDSDAFAEIYALTYKKQYNFACHYLRDEYLAQDVVQAARAEGEGAWHMPLQPAYDSLIKSRLADIKNTGGRWAGAITAAAFLNKFVKSETPWCHIDIAGVALPPGETTLAPKGASGWGVMTLDRLIRDKFEA